MIAKINIHGDIGNGEGELNLMNVIQQVKTQPEATSYLVSINSDGGEVDAGFDIYNYLRSLGLPITTVAENSCCSIATVVFMAGDKRIVKENTMFMIHLPWGTTQGTAEEISVYSEIVKQAEDRLVKFYVDQTSNPKEAIVPLLKQETFMNIEQAISLGFATEVQKIVSAKAYFNTNLNKMQTQLSKEDKSWIETQFNKVLNIGKKPVKASMKLQDGAGVTIEFTDLNEGDVPKVNDVATIDGSPAEGSFVMPDGSTMVFSAGVLTEIVPYEEEGNEELDALKQENAELKEQLANANANFTNLQNEVVNLKKSITSKFNPTAKREPMAKDENNQPTKRKLLKD